MGVRRLGGEKRNNNKKKGEKERNKNTKKENTKSRVEQEWIQARKREIIAKERRIKKDRKKEKQLIQGEKPTNVISNNSFSSLQMATDFFPIFFIFRYHFYLFFSFP